MSKRVYGTLFRKPKAFNFAITTTFRQWLCVCGCIGGSFYLKADLHNVHKLIRIEMKTSSQSTILLAVVL